MVGWAPPSRPPAFQSCKCSGVSNGVVHTHKQLEDTQNHSPRTLPSPLQKGAVSNLQLRQRRAEAEGRGARSPPSVTPSAATCQLSVPLRASVRSNRDSTYLTAGKLVMIRDMFLYHFSSYYALRNYTVLLNLVTETPPGNPGSCSSYP